MMQDGQPTTNGSEGHNGLQDVVTAGNPYVARRRRREEAGSENTPEQARTTTNEVEDEIVLGEGEPKSKRGRRRGFAAFLIFAIAGLAVLLYLKFGYATKIDYVVKAKSKSAAMLQQPGTQQLQGEETAAVDSQVEAAIAQAKEARRAASDPVAQAAEVSSPAVEAAPGSAPRLSLPSDYLEPRPVRIEGAGGSGGTGG